MANQALVTRRRVAGYHGPRRPFNDAASPTSRPTWAMQLAKRAWGERWRRRSARVAASTE
jgi:hypothetical protein